MKPDIYVSDTGHAWSADENPELVYTHKGYYTADQLRQAKVEVLRKYRDSFCWDSSYPGTYRDGLDALIDEIERSKT